VFENDLIYFDELILKTKEIYSSELDKLKNSKLKLVESLNLNSKMNELLKEENNIQRLLEIETEFLLDIFKDSEIADHLKFQKLTFEEENKEKTKKFEEKIKDLKSKIVKKDVIIRETKEYVDECESHIQKYEFKIKMLENSKNRIKF
jgi:hypothetical protein